MSVYTPLGMNNTFELRHQMKRAKEKQQRWLHLFCFHFGVRFVFSISMSKWMQFDKNVRASAWKKVSFDFEQWKTMFIYIFGLFGDFIVGERKQRNLNRLFDASLNSIVVITLHFQAASTKSKNTMMRLVLNSSLFPTNVFSFHNQWIWLFSLSRLRSNQCGATAMAHTWQQK